MRHRSLRPAVIVAVLTTAAVLAAGSAVPGSAAAWQAPRFPAVLTGAGGAARSLLMINRSREQRLVQWRGRRIVQARHPCVAKKGYDAPTGLGGPGAIGAF